MTEPFRIERADLEGPARRAAGWLADNGARREDRVLLAARNHPSTLALALGALRSGVVPVVVGPDLPTEEAEWIRGDARPVLVVEDPAAIPLDEARPADLADVPLGRPM